MSRNLTNKESTRRAIIDLLKQQGEWMLWHYPPNFRYQEWLFVNI
ncbi:hypothetical protein [Paenibacillus sp. IHBB 10380]|nr:hypothetical protein [Paenibacillus sp. IHBB 10380]